MLPTRHALNLSRTSILVLDLDKMQFTVAVEINQQPLSTVFFHEKGAVSSIRV